MKNSDRSQILILAGVWFWQTVATAAFDTSLQRQKRNFSDLTLTDGSITYNLWPILILFFVLYLIRIAKLFASIGGSSSSSSGYGAPSSGYGAPSSGYGAPSSGYGAPNSGYGAPNSGNNTPNSGYGAPNSGYNAPNSGYNAPNNNFGGGGGGGGIANYGSSRFQQIQNAIDQPSFLQDDFLLQDVGNENFLDTVLSFVKQPSFSMPAITNNNNNGNNFSNNNGNNYNNINRQGYGNSNNFNNVNDVTNINNSNYNQLRYLSMRNLQGI